MKESEIRKRLRIVEEQLDRANKTIGDLAKAAAQGVVISVPIPCPAPCPAPQPPADPQRMSPGIFAYATPFQDPPGLLPPIIVGYATPWPNAGGQVTWTWASTTTPPIGKDGK